MKGNLKPAESRSIGGVIKNPLTVFGLILLAGDGPLVTAYALSSDMQQGIILMWATILYIFYMGAFFCFLVAFKPRNLYTPEEFPEFTIERNLYKEPVIRDNVLKETQALVENLIISQNKNQRTSIGQDIYSRLNIVDEVQTAYELLLVPGYEISLILEILKTLDSNKMVISREIAEPRNITDSTIDLIINSMRDKNLIYKNNGDYFLTKFGIKLMYSLEEYLRSNDKFSIKGS